MAKHVRIVPTSLFTPRYRELSVLAQAILLPIKASPHRTTEGLFRLPIAYIVADSGRSEAEVVEGIAELVQKKWFEHHPEAEVFLDIQALDDQRVSGWRQLQGAINALEDVPPTYLKQRFYELAQTKAPELAKAIAGDYTEDVKDRHTGEITVKKLPGVRDLSEYERQSNVIATPFDTPSDSNGFKLDTHPNARVGVGEGASAGGGEEEGASESARVGEEQPVASNGNLSSSTSPADYRLQAKIRAAEERGDIELAHSLQVAAP